MAKLWLQAVLDLIFSKALDQAFFNHLYAQICFRMSSLNVENVQFKKLLLENCTLALPAPPPPSPRVQSK